MDPGSRASRASDPAKGLRAWADALDVVRLLRRALPKESPRCPPGLYVDETPSPWIQAGGEVRVSLLRFICVAPGGRRALVGQLQATEDDGTGKRRLRCYLHRGDVAFTTEVSSVDAWWIGVLEEHYARGGAPVEIG